MLELPKVLARLSCWAVSEAGRTGCLRLRPCKDYAGLRAEADFYAQGQIWLERGGFKLLSFPELDGVWSVLESGPQPIDLDGLWAVRQFLRQAVSLVENISTGGTGKADSPVTENWALLKQRCAEILFPSGSVQALNRCLSDDGTIRDEASPELKLVRLEVRRLHQQCSKKVKDFAQEYNISHYLQDEFITLSSDRYVLPLKSNFKGRLQGIIHDYSQTGETCYFEPLFLVEINNRLQELKREEREEEHKVLQHVSGLLRSELGGLRALYGFMVQVDVLQAKTALAAHYGGRLVLFEEASGEEALGVNLVEANHPLLALAEADSAAAQRGAGGKGGSRGEGSFAGNQPAAALAIPMDIVLKPGQKALIISGGNAGGKTVCLKTLGLTALLGMCAIPVPAGKGSRLPFWGGLYPFIGDEQSLEDHVSTFTAQITRLTEVLKKAGRNALVLLDEFGAGTDPAQGAALAQAVVDELMERGAYAVAATHFPALKAYALSRPAVRAASVLFDPRTKRPLFRLAYDQVGASQALDVAREHGLPESVLKKAEQYLLMDGEDTGALIARLNGLAVEREKELDSLKAEREKFQSRRAKLEERFERERDKLFTSVQEQAAEVLRDWKASRVGHKQTLKQLAALRNDLKKEIMARPEERPVETPDVNSLLPGQKVLYIPWNRKAVVLEKDSRRGKVRLDLNGVAMWADASDVSDHASGSDRGAVSSAPAKTSAQGAEGRPASGFSGNVEQNYALRLDLRGKRADVAINELASFLDSAVMSGREVVEVLHGRGTGALRREVHAFLKTFPAVGDFRLAPEDQGGDGVTFVRLK